ncbi:unnamed protein product, partial [Phaeothamnion confervicola]
AVVAAVARVATALADVMSVVGEHLQEFAIAKQKWALDEWLALVHLVAESSRRELLPLPTLLSNLEPNLLAAAGLLGDSRPQGNLLGGQKEAAFLGSLKKLNTENLYRQQKFNLLREESEGYSKLLEFFSSVADGNGGGGGDDGASANATRIATLQSRTQALMGRFGLDPNRVLDLLLDALEGSLGSAALLGLVDGFRSDAVPHLVGFKMLLYRPSAAAGPAPLTPVSLLRLAALLVAARKMNLADLLPHLHPRLPDMVVWVAARKEDVTPE